MNWYQIEAAGVLHELGSSESGLSEAEARERLQKYGPNRLTEEEGIGKLKMLLHQFASPLIYILLVSAAVTFSLQEYIDTGVIMSVVVLNAIIGYTQEYKAEQGVRALKKLLVSRARVVRDGREKEIDGMELVPGDVVLLASGARAPADLRLLHNNGLRVDESMLTGESLPVEKKTHAIAEDNLAPADQINMAFMGTSVVNGRAKGVAVATGNRTVLGRIAGDVRDIGATKAPVQEKIEKFAEKVGVYVMAACAALFGMGLALGGSVKEMFMVAVATAVAAIPEGLPIVVTIAMAVGVARMAKNKAIIRKLAAVETLGSTTVICSDKTGTLTKNEMTVTALYDGKRAYSVGGIGYEPVGGIIPEGGGEAGGDKEALNKLLMIGLLCNESEIFEEDGRYRVDGDPTEGALIVSALKGGLQCEDEHARHEQIALVPFESERGFMATLNRDDGSNVVYVKGAPEKVVEMAADDMSVKEAYLRKAREFASRGMRVLAFAWKPAPADMDELSHHEAETGLTLAGLQGMMDPPRPEVIEAIKGCRKAGMRVVMITGDHADTAAAIGRELGIVEGDGAVLTGRELAAMSDDELYEKVRKVSVYARVAPDHKLRITLQLKRHGEIVAMTGDGVNDAPALKAAHIGIAMGITGTDVAKEASDMVLADDNFAGIFKAVHEGRIVFDNLRKAVFFLIPTGLAAILSIIAAMILDVPIPYMAAQLLWINLVTNGLQDVALAFEPGEKGIIDRKPRDPNEGIMSRLLFERTLLIGIVIAAGVIFNYVRALDSGGSVEYARTVAVTTLVFFQFFQAWNSRSEHASVFTLNPLGNKFLFYSMIAAALAQFAFIFAPPLQWVFRTEAMDYATLAHVVAVAFSIVVVVEMDKWLRRRKAAA